MLLSAQPEIRPGNQRRGPYEASDYLLKPGMPRAATHSATDHHTKSKPNNTMTQDFTFSIGSGANANAGLAAVCFTGTGSARGPIEPPLSIDVRR